MSKDKSNGDGRANEVVNGTSAYLDGAAHEGGANGRAQPSAPSPDVGATEAAVTGAPKAHAETVAALADSVWGGIAALSQVSGVTPEGKRVDGLSIDVAAAIEALGLVAAKLIDAATEGGPIEHSYQLTGKLAATTHDLLAKLRAIRSAMKPPAIIAPRSRLIIPGGRA